MAVVLNLRLNFDLFEDIFLIHGLSWRRMGNEKLEMLVKLAVMDWFKMPSPYFLGEPEEVHEKPVGVVSLCTEIRICGLPVMSRRDSHSAATLGVRIWKEAVCLCQVG
jgi:hypothetical protein